MMKDAYLSRPGKTTDDQWCATRSQPSGILQEDEEPGPNAMVYLTKMSARTPDVEITRILKEDPDREVNRHNHDFSTLVLTCSIRIGDPSTTRFINAIVTFDFPPEIKILDYSPKERGIITGIIETCGDGISISPALDFSAPALQGISVHAKNTERFRVTVGPEEKMSGTYSKKTGYTLEMPVCELLEYEGMRNNGHEVCWEIFPSMPPQDIELPANERLAVFPLIIQTPRNTSPEMNVRIEGKVKGDLWGVIPIKGSVVLSQNRTVPDIR